MCICALCTKLLFLAVFIVLNLFIEKSYLKFAHSDGTARMQLQHPTKKCNPLTRSPEGCKTDFVAVKDLGYCAQSGNNSEYWHPADEKKDHMQYPCEYLDAFDMEIPGHSQTTMFIPTRRTKFVQTLECQPDAPCPTKDQFTAHSTTFMANVEAFTLLFDHSMVSTELEYEYEAWDMLGFVNPCGKGAVLDEHIVHTGVRSKFRNIMHGTKEEECKFEKQFQPIERSSKLNEEEKSQQESILRQRAMWMTSGWKNFLPFISEWGREKQLAEINKAPFHKIVNGDFITVKEMLKYVGCDLDDENELNRYEGLVLLVDIHYTNFKEYTWPNAARPAYFYSFSIAPNDEYKFMQDTSLNMQVNKEGEQRVLYDYHGIFVVVRQGGELGTFSFFNGFVLLIGLIFIEGLYRSLFLCIILNWTCCGRCDLGRIPLDKEDDRDPYEEEEGGGRPKKDKKSKDHKERSLDYIINHDMEMTQWCPDRPGLFGRSYSGMEEEEFDEENDDYEELELQSDASRTS